MASEFLYLIIWIIIGSLNPPKCVAENKLYDELNIGARIVKEPQDTVARKGSSVTLSCTIEFSNNRGGNGEGQLPPKTNYTWLKDGQEIKFDSSKHLQILRNGESLKIKKVRRTEDNNDEGEYQCLVHIVHNNQRGTLASTTASLRVAYLNPFIEEPANVVAYRGGVALFRCSIEGLPSPNFQWTRKGKLLPQENRFVTFASGFLEISNLTSSDAGSYRCIVNNLAKNKTSQRASLRVRRLGKSQKLNVLATPKNVTVHVGEVAELQCAASGKPEAVIKWKRADGQSVFNNPRCHKYGQGNLRIDNVQRSDTGKYECGISVGNQQPQMYTATLTVLAPPVLTFLYLKDPTYQTASTIRILCQFRGFPPPQVSWKRNGKEIISDNHMEILDNFPFNQTHPFEKVIRVIPGHNMLKISHSEESDSGIYQCFGKNIAGETHGAVMVTVKHSDSAPDPPADVTVFVESDTLVRLHWVRPRSSLVLVAFSAHYIPATGDHSELQKVVPGNVTEMIIPTLKPFTRYRFHMVAYNAQGASHSSDLVFATTDESFPVSAPELSLTSSDPDSLLIQWEHLSPARARGKVIFYLLYLRRYESSIEEYKELGGDEVEFTWTGLEPGEKYEARILPGTRVGYAKLKDDNWPWFIGKTMDPADKFLGVQSENSTTVLVFWDSDNLYSEYPNSLITGYSLSTALVESGEVVSSKDYTAAINSTTLYLLEADTHYVFSLTVFYEDGQNSSYQHQLWMPVEVELYPPATRITATADSATQIRVDWKSVSWEDCDVHYILKYTPQKSDHHTHTEIQQPMEIPQAVSPTVVKNLKPFTKYNIQIFSICGDKKKGSRIVMVTTDESLPSEPLGLTVFAGKDYYSVNVLWEKPNQCNGIIKQYEVRYTENDKLPDIEWIRKVQKKGCETVIGKLKSEQIYYFKVCAVTSVGPGRFTQVMTVRTNPVVSPGDIKEPDGGQVGIILGVLIGGGCIVLCVLVLLCIFCRPCKWCKRSGHITRLGNHTPCHQGNGFDLMSGHLATSRDIDSNQPMLYDNHIDSKGGKSPPVTPGPCNGYATRTHYMPNGNVRTILAENNKPQETSFGPENSQTGILPTCSSIETGETCYSESREFDPDTLDDVDIWDEQESHNNTSALLLNDDSPTNANNVVNRNHGSGLCDSRDNIHLHPGCESVVMINGPQRTSSPQKSSSVRDSYSSGDKQKMNNKERMFGVDKISKNGMELSDVTVNYEDDDSITGSSDDLLLTQQQKPLLPHINDRTHQPFIERYKSKTHPPASPDEYNPQSVEHQQLNLQNHGDDRKIDGNRIFLNEDDDRSENGEDDYVKLADAASLPPPRNQNTSDKADKANNLIKKQPTSGVTLSCSSSSLPAADDLPQSNLTGSSGDVGGNGYGDDDPSCDGGNGSSEESSGPIETQRPTSEGETKRNVAQNLNSADLTSTFTPQQPHNNLKELSSPPHTNIPGQEQGIAHHQMNGGLGHNYHHKENGDLHYQPKNGYAINGNCIRGEDSPLEGNTDSNCGRNKPIVNGHVPTMHHDATFESSGDAPRVNNVIA